MELEQEYTELPLTRLFDTANARVLDFLLSNEGLHYTAGEISELVAVPDRTVKRSLQELLAEQLIRRRKDGRTYHYTADLASPRTNDLLRYINSHCSSTLITSCAETAKRTIPRTGPEAIPVSPCLIL